ncbi:MAG: molybdopterin cofactor-binding domain-containing protein [Pseudomonadota bacterium]
MLSRRAFLYQLGVGGGGVSVLTSCSLVPALPTFGEPDEDDIVSWLQIQPNGRVRFHLPRAEMGQGVETGLATIIAEELNIGLASVDVAYQNTARIPPCQMTVGSQSIENYFALTAQAGAAMRQIMHERAADRAGVPLASVIPITGGFEVSRPKGHAKTLTYARLASPDEVVIHKSPANLKTNTNARSHTTFQQIGRDQPALGLVDIVTGTTRYSRDVRIANTHFGMVAKPAVLSAVVLTYDAPAAKRVPGVVAVVEGPDGQVGVVATTPRAAQRGLDALGVQWKSPSIAEVQAALKLDVDARIAAGDFEHTPEKSGSIDAGKALARQQLSVRYDVPMMAHAAMEPRAGFAHWRRESGRDRCEVWTGTQDPWLIRALVARVLDMSQDDVLVQNVRIGGAFGGRVMCQATVEAAWLSRGAAVPVTVQWSREDEFQHNYVGPPFSSRIDAGVNHDGRITYWHHRMIGAPVLTSAQFVPSHLRWVTDFIADPGTMRGTTLPYAIDHHRLEASDVHIPMPTGPWRGLGAAPNNFAVECAIDELALGAGIDPIDFRILNVREPRLVNVLRTLRERLPDSRASIGIAASVYKGVTFVGVAARVSRRGNAVSVDELWCVHDCGLVLSPDQVRAQIEGNLVWGVGMALYESFDIEDAVVSTKNFDRYRVPRNAEVPSIDIELITSAETPSGAGEAAFAPAAAAIANAVARTTGTRTRTLPIRFPG